MTKDELFEKLLWEKEIYPPSVLDSHYYDTPEMTRIEIILKTLREMGVLLPSGEYAQSRDKERDLSIVITELQRKLPPGPQNPDLRRFQAPQRRLLRPLSHKSPPL